MPTGGGTGGSPGGMFAAGGHEARKGTALHEALMRGGMHDSTHSHPTLDMNSAIADIFKKGQRE